MTTEEFTRPTGRKMADKMRRDAKKMTQALKHLVVEVVPIDSIHPNPYNPNRQSEREFSLLLMSMEDDGFTQPIIVHKQTRQIIDGEHRWRAAHRLGYTEIPAAFIDMTQEQMRISTLRHNRARGSEDMILASAVLQDLRDLGALDKAIDALLLDPKDLDILLRDGCQSFTP